jgi:hypothetical protein
MRELIHQVNNLLAVIEVQVAVARAAASERAARDAIELIERAAARTGETVRRTAAQQR